ncbi:hypothetical protein [Candidatus Albibeggiatoa sp. nov. NOAA]|uniref:hypothetical protein n=1 Tax=Candidatus Albibeggiatoa sp. nov. NOAA TaxID=3162724 RepID=UPI0032F4DD9C|nr:hypothetical protein [Thiotrichaceae bacterium]
MNQEKSTLKLRRPPNITKNAGFGYIILILFLSIPVLIGIYNDYRNDFALLDLIFTHTHPVVIGIVFTLTGFIFLLVSLQATAVTRASLTLDNQGIRYYSAMPFGVGEDWDLSWEDIHEICVTPLGEIIFVTNYQTLGDNYNQILSDTYRYRGRKTYIFGWFDKTTQRNTQTLDANSLARNYTPEKYKAILSYLPLYQYFIQHQIEVKIPEKLSLSDKISTSPYTPMAGASLTAFLFFSG